MTEHSPLEGIARQGQLARTHERDSDFAQRMARFGMEVVDAITPETDPKDVYAALWALSRFAHDYADPPHSEDIDPSTVAEIGDIALSIFGNLANLHDAEIDRLGEEGDRLANLYMEGFPTSMSSPPMTDQAAE